MELVTELLQHKGSNGSKCSMKLNNRDLPSTPKEILESATNI